MQVLPVEMLFAGQGVWYRFQSSPRPEITEEKGDIPCQHTKRPYVWSYLCKNATCGVFQGEVKDF